MNHSSVRGAARTNRSVNTQSRTWAAAVLALGLVFAFVVPAGAVSHTIEVNAPDHVSDGEVATVTFTTDVPDGTEVFLEELHGDDWQRGSLWTAVAGGTGQLELEPTTDQVYRLWSDSAVSKDFTIDVEATADDSETADERNAIAPQNTEDPVEFTISAPSTIALGSPATVDFTTSLPNGSRVYVDYRTDGPWQQSAVNTTVSAGEGTVKWTPNSDRTYRLRGGSEYSSEFSINVDSTIEASAPASIQYGEHASVKFTTGVAPGSRVHVEFLRNGSWIRSSVSTTVSDGAGTLKWTPNSDRTYRLRVGNATSSEFTIRVAASFSVTARPVIVYGDRLTASFTTNLPNNSLVTVHYKSGNQWVKSSVSTRVSNGKGSISWTPAGDRAYKLVSNLGSSDSFWTQVKPRVSVSAPQQIDRGERVTVNVTTTPKASGTIDVDYRFNGGAWRTSSVRINVVNGKGSASWVPSSTREYRLRSSQLGYRNFSVSVGSINTAILNMALTQSGYEEPSWRNNKYNSWIGGNNAWCSVFVSWAAAQAGYGHVVPQSKSFAGFVSALEAEGVLRSGNTAPGPGAVVLFDWGNANPSHAGFVVSRSGSTLRTVEGNTTDGSGDPQRGVYERTRSTASVWKWFYPSDLL